MSRNDCLNCGRSEFVWRHATECTKCRKTKRESELQASVAELEAENKRLREAAEAVLWASNAERIYAAEGEELVAMVKERREAFAALSVALKGKQE